MYFLGGVCSSVVCLCANRQGGEKRCRRGGAGRGGARGGGKGRVAGAPCGEQGGRAFCATFDGYTSSSELAGHGPSLGSGVSRLSPRPRAGPSMTSELHDGVAAPEIELDGTLIDLGFSVFDVSSPISPLATPNLSEAGQSDRFAWASEGLPNSGADALDGAAPEEVTEAPLPAEPDVSAAPASSGSAGHSTHSGTSTPPSSDCLDVEVPARALCTALVPAGFAATGPSGLATLGARASRSRLLDDILCTHALRMESFHHSEADVLLRARDAGDPLLADAFLPDQKCVNRVEILRNSAFFVQGNSKCNLPKGNLSDGFVKFTGASASGGSLKSSKKAGDPPYMSEVLPPPATML